MSGAQLPLFPEDAAQVDFLAEFQGRDGQKSKLLDVVQFKINRAAAKTPKSQKRLQEA